MVIAWLSAAFEAQVATPEVSQTTSLCLFHLPPIYVYTPPSAVLSFSTCSSQEELDKLKFFAKPKLALDAVGGTSAVRICDALAEVPQLSLHTI